MKSVKLETLNAGDRCWYKGKKCTVISGHSWRRFLIDDNLNLVYKNTYDVVYWNDTVQICRKVHEIPAGEEFKYDGQSFIAGLYKIDTGIKNCWNIDKSQKNFFWGPNTEESADA